MENNKSDFEINGQSSHMWLSSATQLKKAADLVYEELRKALSIYPFGRAPYEDLVLFKSYMLLAGLALENLVKGILIGRNPDIVNSTGMASNLLNHELTKLVQETAIQLSPIEEDIINRLTKFIVWAGRYPIHKKANQSIQPSFNSNDSELIDELFEKFVGILKKENQSSITHFA